MYSNRSLKRLALNTETVHHGAGTGLRDILLKDAYRCTVYNGVQTNNIKVLCVCRRRTKKLNWLTLWFNDIELEKQVRLCFYIVLL